MSMYVRPDITPRVFRDADGQIIEYGNRWPGASPPDDTYSVASHPERFLPLHTIADALIDYLTATFDVDVDHRPGHAAELIHPRNDVIRTVRVIPRSPGAAALSFVFTSYPGVIIHAGIFHESPFPICGCDACDESWETLAEMMERHVQAVAAGNFREFVRPSPILSIGYEIRTTADGGPAQSGEERLFPGDPRRARATEVMNAPGLPPWWRAWPRNLAAMQ